MFIQSRNYTKGRKNRPVRLIVIHTMETPETVGRAKQVANWFKGSTAPDASAHYCIDNKDIISTVDDKDTAWSTGVSEVNQISISIELAGKASQNRMQWKDQYSSAMLANAARLTAFLCKKHNIPVVKLSPNQIKLGKGIIGHNTVTAAYKVKGGHSDPGNNFPWDDFIKLVESEYTQLKGAK
jgi:N-acetyl-anhydromuramyl-L-alanine amidase AmpD